MRYPISVVLITYLRTTYVAEAFRSILDQNTPRPFEIVLLSAIRDFRVARESERAAGERGVTINYVTVAPGPIGLALQAALACAKGDVIALLDDDDLWEPAKIESVVRVFEERPDAIFFHNSQTFVDGGNTPLSFLGPTRILRHPSSLMPEGRSLWVAAADASGLPRALRFEPDFNNSSIAFRRELLDPYTSYLPKLSKGEDTFLFYGALSSGRPAFLTSSRLTRYRVHSSSISAPQHTAVQASSEPSSYDQFIQGHLEMFRVAMNEAARRDLVHVRDLIQGDIALWETFQALWAGEGSWPETVRRTRALMQYGAGHPRPRELFGATSGVLNAIAPKIAGQMFRRWREFR
ncbi:MAG: glycosyltransferase family 2 protein [Thermoplasmata archaeon]